MSEKLREVREYEAIHGARIKEEERPVFHLTPYAGWMNDPNGFSYYNGKYHMFYQYHPYRSLWGPMHWGHALSMDLLHWEYLPAALAPDRVYDKDGCFSGSAVTLPDGRQLLMYTGVRKEEDKNGDIREFQTQSLAVGDGKDYEKWEKNPVLTAADVPKGSSFTDFRDPKIIPAKDGYYCVAGSRPADGSGQILLYHSTDGFDWKFKSILVQNQNRFGKMWECPDFFELDGKWVLLTSPQDMLPEGFEYHNGNGTLCLMGSFDEEKGIFQEEKNQAIDYGIDFYAPQTVLTPDERRVMIGWMQNWDACAIRDAEEPWAGQMSLPRELRIKDGRLYQWPVKELEALRKDRVVHENVTMSGRVLLDGVHGRCADIILKIRPKDPKNCYHKFSMRFAENEEYHTTISFRPREGVLKVDRKFSGSRRAIIHQRRSLVEESRDGVITLRIILDRFSTEVFVNDGASVMTCATYTDPSVEGISFFTDGEAVVDVEKYDLTL